MGRKIQLYKKSESRFFSPRWKPSTKQPPSQTIIPCFQLNQPKRCSDFSTLLLDVKIQLNMFRASSCPSSGATTTAVAASGLPPSSDSRLEAATAVVVAPDDGHEDARKMLSCI
jgi:hypothetical protein